MKSYEYFCEWIPHHVMKIRAKSSSRKRKIIQYYHTRHSKYLTTFYMRSIFTS